MPNFFRITYKNSETKIAVAAIKLKRTRVPFQYPVWKAALQSCDRCIRVVSRSQDPGPSSASVAVWWPATCPPSHCTYLMSIKPLAEQCLYMALSAGQIIFGVGERKLTFPTCLMPGSMPHATTRSHFGMLDGCDDTHSGEGELKSLQKIEKLEVCVAFIGICSTGLDLTGKYFTVG